MANSGSGRRSGSGNRRPSGTGNRSGNPRRSGAPAQRPGGKAAGAPTTANGATNGARPGNDEVTKGAATRAAVGSSTADERARERLAERRLSGGRRSGQTAHSRPRQAPSRGRPAPSGRGAKNRRGGPQGRKSSTNAAIFGSVFVVLAVVIIIVIATVGGSSPQKAGGQIATLPASPSLVNAVSHVPASSFAAAGSNSPNVSDQGGLVALPSSAPHPTSGGKPEVVYIGAEYCPYCAAFRWPFIIALSRFGTFTGLKQTGSGSHDVYPNTHTLSFYGAKYSSPYISLSATELETNICTDVTSQGCLSYKPLQTPSAANGRLISTYDVAKYFPATISPQTGGNPIPFVYWGGKYVESGGFYNPQQLQGFTYADIEAALKHPNLGVGQSILQAANIYTAVICKMDGGQPASVCATAPVKAAMAALPKATK